MTADGIGMMGNDDEMAIDFDDAAPKGPLCCCTTLCCDIPTPVNVDGIPPND